MTWSEHWVGLKGKYADDALQATRRHVRSVSEMAQLKVHASHAEAITEKLHPLEDAHHLVYQTKMAGPFRNGLKPGGGPCVNIDYEWNRGGMNKALDDANAKPGRSYDLKNLSPEQAAELLSDVYADAPLLRNAALLYLKDR
jgi:hypothetical protein